MELSNIQANAVRQLLKKYQTWRVQPKDANKVTTFVAPTGAGKTFMISHFVSGLFKDYPQDKIVIFLATLSMAALPKQFADKVKQKYMDHLPFKFNVVYKEAPSSKKSKAKDFQPSLLANEQTLLIVGRSSFTKSSLFIQQGCFEQFLTQIKNENYRLIYIRDEAHHGAENLRGELKFEARIQSEAAFVLKMSATLEKRANGVEICETDLKQDNLKLLKTGVKEWNYGLKQITDEFDELALVRHCLKVFKTEIIVKYRQESQKIGQTIRPALLMQIKSERKGEENSAEFKTMINQIIQEIRKVNLNYAVYFDKSKYSNLRTNVNLLELSANDSPIDVILFKVGPATGWDIPRACMLVQLRNVGSWKLIQQTMGRIKRYPVPELGKELSPESIFNQYFVYARRKFEQQLTFFNYKLKPQYQKINWITGKIVNWKQEKQAQTELYQNGIYEILQKGVEKSQRIQLIVSEIQKKKEHVFHLIEFDRLWQKKFFRSKEVVKNTLELQKYLHRKKRRYSIFFHPLDSVLEKILVKYKKQVLNQLVLIWYLLEVLDEVKNHYEKCFSGKNSKFQYQLNDCQQAEPSYTLINNQTAEKSNYVDVETSSNYLYQVDQMEQKQLLDSRVESKFFGIMQQFFHDEGYDDVNFKRQLIWGKNPNRGQIHLEYVEDNKIRRLFPDFIAQLGVYTIYVEVKALDDLNPIKTNLIRQVFQDYMQQNRNTKLILSICKIDLSKPFNPLQKCENISQIPTIESSLNLRYVFKEIYKLIKEEPNDQESSNCEN